MSSIRSAFQQEAKSTNPQLYDRVALVSHGTPVDDLRYAHGSTFKIKLTARGAAANCMSDCSTSKGTFLRVTAHFYRLEEG